MTINPLNIIRVPFLVAERITRPIMDVVEKYIGEEVDQVVDVIPGGKQLEKATGSAHGWLTASAGKKDPNGIEDAEIAGGEKDG